MNKKITFFIFIILIFIISGCSKYDQSDGYDKSNSDQNDESSERLTSNVKERKIIYTVNANIYTELSFDDAIDLLYSLKEEDEWFDSEEISDNYGRFIIRIKSSRIDNFVSYLKQIGDVRNYNKKGNDISTIYEDTSNRIASLEAELDRLLVLYEQASMGEIIQINQRIAQIELELGKLNSDLKEYDSLVDYSTINITLQTKGIANDTPFGKKVGNAFKNGWQAFVVLLEYTLIAIIAISPFALIAVPIVGVIIYRKKKRNKNKIQ